MENGTELARIADQLRSENIPICTTMILDDIIQMKLFHPDDFFARPENAYFKRGYLETFQQGKDKHQLQCQGIEDLCAFKHWADLWILRGLHEAGVLLLLGTDAGTGGMGIVPGYSVHD